MLHHYARSASVFHDFRHSASLRGALGSSSNAKNFSGKAHPLTESEQLSSDRWGETLKRLGPEGKLRAAQLLYFTARRIKEGAIRTKHPEWTDAEVKQALNEAFWNARD